MKKKNNLLLGVVLLLVVVAAVLGIILNNRGTISKKEAAAQGESFVNSFLMQPGSVALVKEVSKEYDLYKLKIDIGSGQMVDSYLSRDGKLFFPQALDVAEVREEMANTNTNADGENQAAVTQDIPKSEKPEVELFVMSYCPYGLQMEKGLFPVVDLLGNKIDFELKFNDYIMHGEQEIEENLVQYCIQKEEPNKLNDYVSCFVKAGDTEGCLVEAGVNKSKNDVCVEATDKEYKIMENFANKVGYTGSYPGFDVYKEDNDRYGVGGSPTLIINGVEVSAARDSASLLQTICGAFENAPEECNNTDLPTATPSAGLGVGTTNTAVAAACE
jgi:glutaredoxin